MSRVVWHGEEFERIVRTAVERDGLPAAGIELQREMTGLLKRRRGPSLPGEPPGLDTGTLARSVNVTEPENLSIRVGTDLPYGRHLEFGAVVTAKKAKYLTIPLNRAAKMMRRRNTTLRSVAGLFPLIRPGKTPLLARRKVRGKDKTIEPMFALKKTVRIEARPWMRPALDNAKDEMQAAFSDATRRGVKRRIREMVVSK